MAKTSNGVLQAPTGQGHSRAVVVEGTAASRADEDASEADHSGTPQGQQLQRSRSATLETISSGFQLTTATSSTGTSSPVNERGYNNKHDAADGQLATDAAAADLLSPHTLTYEQVVLNLNSNLTVGLTDVEAKQRQAKHGPNTIRETKGVSAWTILVRQFANALTVILLAVMALSFGVNDVVEGSVVAAVIAVNTIIGFFQELKAERTMASLRTLSAPEANVVRDGIIVAVAARDLTLGDVVVFNSGDLLPADVRLTSVINLEVDEAPLTGESLPVIKHTNAIVGAHLGPADRVNLAYAGTVVTKGRGRGIVVATAGDTQLGQIASAMDPRAERRAAQKHMSWPRRTWEFCARIFGLREGTPLQRKLSLFALILLGLAIACALVVFGVAEFQLNDQVILYAVALGISVLPECLQVTIAICFAAGAKRMAQQGVIVRKLAALENLSGIDVLCSDKTGTLTLGSMVVREFWLPQNNQSFTVQHTGTNALEPKGSIHAGNGEDAEKQPEIDAQQRTDMHDLIAAASLCNVAEISPGEKDANWVGRGDPTELALQVLAHKLELSRPSLVGSSFTLEQEHPFDSAVKRMTSIYSAADDQDYHFYMKGGLDQVLECCDGVGADQYATISARMERMASKGLRVLAFAQRRLAAHLLDEQPIKGEPLAIKREAAEQHFTFIGLIGLYDPPRPETRGSVEIVHKAGIMVIMATGDHPATAKAIALDVGIITPDAPASAVMTAAAFDALSDAEVDALPELPRVVARCTPNTKVRIISAARRRGMRMAMTGDGVNDAPALLSADVGIAMAGTDVAKDSSELVSVDAKFDSITKGIRHGRSIFLNIQKFLVALLVVNVAEIILLMIGLAFRDEGPDPESIFPLSPLGVLFLNLIVGLPSIALGLEAPEPGIMARPPQKTGAFSRQVIVDVLVYGTVMGASCMAVFCAVLYGLHDGNLGMDCNHSTGPSCRGIMEARSTTFATLFVQSMIITWMLLSVERSFFAINPVARLRQNPFLLWSVILGVCLIPLCIWLPGWAPALKQGGVGWQGALLCIAAVAFFIASVELWKWLARRGAWPWLTRVSGGSETWRADKAAREAHLAEEAASKA